MSSNVATFAVLAAFADSKNIDIDSMDPKTGMDDLRRMYAESLGPVNGDAASATPRKERENKEYVILLVNKADGSFVVHGSAMSGKVGGLNDLREFAGLKIARAADKGTVLVPIEISAETWATGSSLTRKEREST